MRNNKCSSFDSCIAFAYRLSQNDRLHLTDLLPREANLGCLLTYARLISTPSCTMEPNTTLSMSSLELSIKPRNGGGGQQTRRQRGNSNSQQRMGFSSKSQERTGSSNRKMKERNTATPLSFSPTSARKDPTLARNKYPYYQNNYSYTKDLVNAHQRQRKNRTRDARTDVATDRESNEDVSREGVEEIAPVTEVTVPPPEDEPEPTVVDEFGDEVVSANDWLVALIFDNKVITKAFFPYMDGDYYNPDHADECDHDYACGLYETGSTEEFYQGLMNYTISQEGFEATPTALYDTQTNAKVDEDGMGKKAGIFGMLAMIPKTFKRSDKNRSDADAEAESEPACARTFEEEEGVEVQRGNDIDTQGLSQEANVLMSMYDPALDWTNTEETEGTIVEGQDLEVEMLGDRNILAQGVGAFAIWGEDDDNTIYTSDQREFTLEDYSNQQDEADTTNETELRKVKKGLRRRMKTKKLRASKKSLRSTPREPEPAMPTIMDEKLLTLDETLGEGDESVLSSDHWENTIGDYTRPALVSRISTLNTTENDEPEDDRGKVDDMATNAFEVEESPFEVEQCLTEESDTSTIHDIYYVDPWWKLWK